MISAIVLAAGRSRRMGAQKLLLPLGGQPVIARIVDELLGGPVDEVIVVIGQDGQRIRQVLAGRRVHPVVNPDTEGDMLSSVRCGLRAMPRQCHAALVVLGDQPEISRAVVAELVRALRAGSRGIVVPTFQGRRGHPLLFSANYRNEILNHYDDVGLRGLLQAHANDVAEIEVSTPEVVEDMDRAEDYQRMKSRFVQRPMRDTTTEPSD